VVVRERDADLVVDHRCRARIVGVRLVGRRQKPPATAAACATSTFSSRTSRQPTAFANRVTVATLTCASRKRADAGMRGARQIGEDERGDLALGVAQFGRAFGDACDDVDGRLRKLHG
jgi:hypothetical protein